MLLRARGGPVFVLMLASLSACNQPRCTGLSRQAVEEGEDTPAGSVDALMEAVSMDGEYPAAWWDGQPVLATLRITRGEGHAEWVEQEEREARLLRPWTNDLQVFCPDYLTVPLQVVLGAEQELDLSMSGQVVRWEESGDALYSVSATVPYQEGLLPETDRDPTLYSDKGILISVKVLDGDMWRGRVAWTGERELEGGVQYMSETVLEFDEVME
jgi:hypothetical protein